MPKIESPTPKRLRIEMADASWRDTSTIIAVAGNTRIKVTAIEVTDYSTNHYGPDNPGGLVLHLDEAKFTELVKAHAKAILANLVQ